MKTSLRNTPLLLAFLCGQGFAQEVRTALPRTVAVIPEFIENTTPSEQPPVQEKPDFQIESTQVKLIDVVEAPPMPGLPRVEGTMTLRVHSVADPRIPEPTPPALQPKNQEPQQEITEAVETHIDTHLAMVSATVYNNSRTLLTCSLNGDADKAVTVWSNMDFNHFSGIGTVEARDANSKVRSYHLIMAISNETTDKRDQSDASDVAKIPNLPNGIPAFVIQSGDQPDPAALTLIEDLHALYRTEGTRMAEAAAAREKEYQQKKAELLANPPKPKDITVHFWNREHSVTQTEGAQP